jgi:hypothetical protein
VQRENIEYPNSLWVKLVEGQISFAEWKELKTNIPVTEIKMQEFDLAAHQGFNPSDPKLCRRTHAVFLCPCRSHRMKLDILAIVATVRRLSNTGRLYGHKA